MISTMPLLIILLAVMAVSLFYLIQAEGGFGELPRLMERVGISLDKIPFSNIIFSDTEEVPVEGELNDQ